MLSAEFERVTTVFMALTHVPVHERTEEMESLLDDVVASMRLLTIRGDISLASVYPLQTEEE